METSKRIFRLRLLYQNLEMSRHRGRKLTGFAFRTKLVSGVKMQSLEMVTQSGRVFNIKKIIRQGRAMGLGDDRNVIKRTFLAVSEETPPDKKCFV